MFYLTLNHSTPEVVRLLQQRVVQRCERVDDGSPFQCTPHYDTQPNASKLCIERIDLTLLLTQVYKAAPFVLILP